MSSDEAQECPLCMEPLELDDLNFYPCKCEYQCCMNHEEGNGVQICRFCWHRIRTDENGLCPACRAPYPEDPVNFKPLSAQELARIKNEKKAKQAQQKHRMSESRKHLANLRVIQENLVYVMGLSPRIADNETLKKSEYFGKFGRIIKVAVGAPSGQSQSSCTAYVTYSRAEEALRAIQAVNNVSVEGRTVKASLGTTKYCSAYLRNQPCHKPECMYLHELAKEEASFTKDDMQAGKHTEYERKLHEAMLNNMRPSESWTRPTSRGPVNGVLSEPNGIPPPPERKHSAPPTSSSSSSTFTQPPRYARLKTMSSVDTVSESTKTTTIASSNNGSGNSSVMTVDDEDMGRILAAISAQASNRQSVYSKPEPLPIPGAASEEDEEPHFCLDERGWKQSNGPSHIPNASQPTPPDKGEAEPVAPTPAAPSGLTTDWQVAFGLKKVGVTASSGPPTSAAAPSLPAAQPRPPPKDAHPHLPASLFDDDALGFDPFSESSKGLADLLEEEERERERAKQQGKSGKGAAMPLRPNGFNQSRLGSSWSSNPPGQSSVSGSFGSNGSHRTGMVSPSSFLGAFAKNGGLKPGSLPNSEGGGTSPVSASSFTTPPPGFPPISDNGSNGGGGGHFGPPNGLRHPFPPPPGFPPPPPFREPSPSQSRPPPPHLFHHPHPPHSGPPPHHHLSQSPADNSGSPFNLTEWQEGLKNLLPNVNVHFAPGLGKNPGNGGWNGNNMGRGGGPPTPSGPPPGLPPFHQPPPPLSVSTAGGPGGPAPPASMRPSPPDHHGYHRMPPPPHAPRPPPPPGFPGAQGGWNCLTPPPPGFSPRQH